MGKATSRVPLLFQSKLLCFSLFYLSSSLFLALYSSLSSTKCLFFRSSPFDPIQTPLFSYPSTYGQHKYAIPTLRSSCTSPVYFSDYSMVLKEIREFCRNSSLSGFPHHPKYMQGKAQSFGGNFTTQQRISYFDYSDVRLEIPCGFFLEFPISNSDRNAMEKCNEVVVVSAIFGDHDKIRQPKGLGSKTLDHVCFFMFVDDSTLTGLHSHNLIPKTNSLEEKKIRCLENYQENVDMAISRHPYYIHTMEEAMATARWKKWWDVDSLKKQMETYCENGLQPWTPNKLPYPSDVPDSALIVRKHSLASNHFSCLLFNELEAYNPRDQLAFAYVRDQMKPTKLRLNMFDVEVFEQVVVEYRHNLLKQQSGPTSSAAAAAVPKTKRATSDLFLNGSCSKCDGYLLQMWGESHD
ncbi:hypothetical protein Vadar_011521 [Vaccinium darrowii]|uniref:Uncharacterized protein n=1 Tax=Vaccinium darrowii TaxID=229202 RepID=A0ACB7XGT5_9ERIC|nr:hypothetical protein Vadar_011521 [Vaccinium darrowii]